MSNIALTPLKNKRWLFPETGKAGFHYEDVSRAVKGLQRDLHQAYAGAHEEELLSWVKKWFPDAIDQESSSSPVSSRGEKPSPEKEHQLTIMTFG